ncbi:MAG: hypothetical protein FWG21_01640 [Oscillospiraceae bacterium]|nr:hypothetical protein [Oscillospiraceae bacterium]
MSDWTDFEDVKQQVAVYGITLVEGDTSVLAEPITIESKVIHNRLLIQPVEGTDADAYGNPTELTERRYLRYAKGGAGVIWMEAVALDSSLRSNERQLVLSEVTYDSFARLIEEMKQTAFAANGYAPTVVIQLSHPGRSCLIPKPAYDNEMWETVRSAKNQPVVSDDEIERLAPLYGDIARLAARAGFDGVEIKACHHFFINELLAATGRPGRYGGAYENRVRHLKETVAAVRALTNDVFITTRLNHYDGIPYPDGFGMKSDGSWLPDGSEPLRLIEELNEEYGVELINCSSSGPEFELFNNRNAVDQLFGEPMTPLRSGVCMHLFAKEIKQNLPGIKVVATQFSHLKQYAASVGAYLVESGGADFIGFGRQALAYPDFASDILKKGMMDKDKVCLCCGGCHRMMGSEKGAGCTVRDPFYRS